MIHFFPIKAGWLVNEYKIQTPMNTLYTKWPQCGQFTVNFNTPNPTDKHTTRYYTLHHNA